MKKRLVKKALKKAMFGTPCRIKLKGKKMNKALYVIKTAGLVANAFKSELPIQEAALKACEIALTRSRAFDIISQPRPSHGIGGIVESGNEMILKR